MFLHEQPSPGPRKCEDVVWLALGPFSPLVGATRTGRARVRAEFTNQQWSGESLAREVLSLPR